MRIGKQFFKKCEEKTIKFFKWFFIDVVLEKILYDLDLIKFHPTKKLRLDAETKAYQVGKFKLVTRIKLPLFRRIKLGFKENPQIAFILLASTFCPQISLLAIPLFFGAIEYGAVTSDKKDSAGTTLSYSHTAATGSNVVAITGIAAREYLNGTFNPSVTYAGSGMTREIYVTGGASGNWTVSALFSKGSPTSGSQTVAINYGTSVLYMSSGTISFTGGKPADVCGANDSCINSVATNVNQSITTTVDNSYIVDCLSTRYPGESVSGTGQVKRWSQSGITNNGRGSTVLTTAYGAYSLIWGSWTAGPTAWTCVEVFAGIEAPTVTTQAVSSIAQTTATGNGNITDDGGDAGATRGMCWDTSPTPTTADDKATNGTGEGAYTVAMTGLVAGTHYYVRAYSINSAGTSYGGEVEFDTLPYVRTKEITARGRIKQEGIEKKITARGRIERAGIEKKVTARGRIEQSDITKAITSRARVQTNPSKVITALAKIKATIEKSITARGRVKLEGVEKKTTARGRIEQADIAKAITSKANIKVTQSKALTSLARLKLLVEKAVTSKARIQALEEEKITARARVQQAGVEKKITAKGTIKQFAVEKKITMRARLKQIRTSSILTILGRIKTIAVEKAMTLKARIETAGIGKALSSRGFIVSVGKTILDSPITGSSELSPITFEWIIPSNRWGENMNFHLQVDQSSDSFEDLEVEKKSWQDAGFEYWNGSDWVPLTTDGVGNAYDGNKARYVTAITAGVKYWRVKAFAG